MKTKNPLALKNKSDLADRLRRAHGCVAARYSRSQACIQAYQMLQRTALLMETGQQASDDPGKLWLAMHHAYDAATQFMSEVKRVKEDSAYKVVCAGGRPLDRSARRLIGKKRSVHPRSLGLDELPDTLPGDWGAYMRKNRDTGELERVSEPCTLGWDTLQKLVDLCRKHGLYFDVTGNSVNFPGSACQIVVRRQPKPKSRAKT